MPQIEKPDDLQSITNLIRFLCMNDDLLLCWKLIFMYQNASVNLNEISGELVEQRCFPKRQFFVHKKSKNRRS